MFPIQGPSPTEIKNAAQYLYAKWKRHSNEKRLEVTSAARSNQRLLDVLTTLYENHEFLRFRGTEFPIIRIPIPAGQTSEPESILGTLHYDRRAHVEPSLRDAGLPFLALLRDLNRPLIDLPTYCFQKLRTEGGQLKVDCTLGNYFDAIVSCDILEWEILNQIGKLGASDNINQFFEKNLRLRAYVHQLGKFEDPILVPKGRSAALSISTLVLFKRGNEFCVLVGERSKGGVAVHGDLYHVVPSGMFQPIVGDFVGEFSVLHSFFREYMEELFGFTEVQTPPAAIAHDYFYDDPNLKFLRKLIAANDAQMFLTGLVVNALNLRPEICTMLVINTPDWFEAHKRGHGPLSRIELNEEWKRPSEKLAGKPNVISINDLSDFGFDFGNVVPPGAAAIILGLETAKSLKLL